MTSKEALQTINRTIELLKDKDKWKKESAYKEDCERQSEKLTLGSALVKAQTEVLGEANFRNLVMGRVRGKIYYHFFWRAGIHPITYFNRNKRTTHENIIFLLIKVKQSFEAEL